MLILNIFLYKYCKIQIHQSVQKYTGQTQTNPPISPEKKKRVEKLVNWLTGLNLNITVNMRGCFKLTDFGPFCTLFFLFSWWAVSECTLEYMMVLWNIFRICDYLCLLGLFTDVCGYSVVMWEQFSPLNLGILVFLQEIRIQWGLT
jgi:hypothetical protein